MLSCRRFLSTVPSSQIELEQRFITAGGFTGDQVNQAMEVQAMCTPSVVPELVSNTEESDTMIWLQALYSRDKNVLVLSGREL